MTTYSFTGSSCVKEHQHINGLKMNQIELVSVSCHRHKLPWPKFQLTELFQNSQKRHFCDSTLHPAHTAGTAPKSMEVRALVIWGWLAYDQCKQL